ncbi:MAG: formyltetrahydrofolate deformylase [Nocardioidaceae bacterium]
MTSASTVGRINHEFILTLRCADRPAIVHAVSGFLVEHSGNIITSAQFGDAETGRFFMRVHFEVSADTSNIQNREVSADTSNIQNREVSDAEPLIARLRGDFQQVANRFEMTWEMWGAGARYRTLILVSRFGHCLNDLLFRWSTGALQIDVPAIVSNHRDFEALATSYGIPFHHIPVTADTKIGAEQQLLELVDDLNIHLVVLARYMQVLSDHACRVLSGRAINIHHSFLPSFKGAKPYHQAHSRGVKLIGATAHYITSDLDEGPIIEQDVARVDHNSTPEQLVSAGRDVESAVLSRAVRWHSEQRVMLNDTKTVVFS